MTARPGGGRYYVGLNADPTDPSAAIVRDGVVIAFAEEERFVRYKHAYGHYPSRALRFCLQRAGIELRDVAAVAINWNLQAYTDGTMERFYRALREKYPVDPQTIAWQNSRLRKRNLGETRRFHERHWKRLFGGDGFPPVVGVPHHFTHAFQAYMQSPFDAALVLTVDGSGDQHCTVLWEARGREIRPIREITMPDSLGWFYAAFTEYLGFEAYDGEYKVMGLAAYGRSDPDLLARMRRIVRLDEGGPGYRIDPTYLHYGPRTYSDRFTDRLVELLGRPPRLPGEEIAPWHEDLAHAVQETLEEAVERLVAWGVREVRVPRVCISGGVGQNIKMNTRLFHHPTVESVFAHPLCSDAGAAAGAALAACYRDTGAEPEKLKTLALGNEESDEEIERALKLTLVDYDEPDDICEAVAEELARGRIVGWFQGRMEVGPRALGQRSILADPRRPENRDRVNAIIKFREYWRPFCPSMTAEASPRYFEACVDAPFMIIAFRANDRLRRDAPAIVHVDGTSRVQMVHREMHPLFHRLLEAFGRRTGVPVLLNTSFNVKGEPIVCTIRDALRTFWATGLEVLAAGRFLIRKPGVHGRGPEQQLRSGAPETPRGD
jgi:carbamoyltransferase